GNGSARKVSRRSCTTWGGTSAKRTTSSPSTRTWPGGWNKPSSPGTANSWRPGGKARGPPRKSRRSNGAVPLAGPALPPGGRGVAAERAGRLLEEFVVLEEFLRVEGPGLLGQHPPVPVLRPLLERVRHQLAANPPVIG